MIDWQDNRAPKLAGGAWHFPAKEMDLTVAPWLMLRVVATMNAVAKSDRWGLECFWRLAMNSRKFHLTWDAWTSESEFSCSTTLMKPESGSLNF